MAPAMRAAEIRRSARRGARPVVARTSAPFHRAGRRCAVVQPDPRARSAERAVLGRAFHRQAATRFLTEKARNHGQIAVSMPSCEHAGRGAAGARGGAR